MCFVLVKDILILESSALDRSAILTTRPIGLLGKDFANSPGDRGSVPGRVVPKTKNMVLDISLLNTQYDKVRIKGKVEQSKEISGVLPYTSAL